jgi:hypothetical protein
MQYALNLTNAQWKGEAMLAADIPGDSLTVVTSQLCKDFPTAQAETGFLGDSSSLVS